MSVALTKTSPKNSTFPRATTDCGLTTAKSPGSLRGLSRLWCLLQGGACTADGPKSVAIMIRLERAFRLDADIVGLVLAQLGELDADLGEMQPRHLLVQRLRQHVDLLLVLAVLVVG